MQPQAEPDGDHKLQYQSTNTHLHKKMKKVCMYMYYTCAHGQNQTKKSRALHAITELVPARICRGSLTVEAHLRQL